VIADIDVGARQFNQRRKIITIDFENLV